MLFPTVFSNYVLLLSGNLTSRSSVVCPPLPMQLTPLGARRLTTLTGDFIVSFRSFGRVLRECLHMPDHFFTYQSQFSPSFSNRAEINNPTKKLRKEPTNAPVSIIFRLSCEGEATLLMYYLLSNFLRISNYFEILNCLLLERRQHAMRRRACYWKGKQNINKSTPRNILGPKYFSWRFNFNRFLLLLRLQRMEPNF
jgi:hypothetical protein